MKKLLLALLSSLVLLGPVAALGGTAAAANVFQACTNGTAPNTDVCKQAGSQSGNNGTNNPIVGIIKTAINIISYIVGIAAVIGIIASGLRMILSGGNSEKIASGRTGVLYSVIGIMVVVLAQAIVVFVLNNN